MTIEPSILDHFQDLKDAQRAIIGHDEGPLLVNVPITDHVALREMRARLILELISQQI
jgi:hypothetical protein